MKILFLASADKIPSTRFLILPYIPHLRALGHECKVAMSIPYTGLRLLENRLSEIPRAVRRPGSTGGFRAAFGELGAVAYNRISFRRASIG